MNSSNGRVIYRGPSMLDGSPIVVVAVGLKITSKNRKTGNMIQTHILRADITPTDAIKTGNDASICGDCKHRGDGTGKGRTCYVNVGQGPLVVYKTLMRGGYPDALTNFERRAIGRARLVRIGTYGDPAAVPLTVWHDLLADAVGHTGYTHQWKQFPDVAALRSICMASVDNIEEAALAQSHGWRTFRVALPSHVARIKGEAICPASEEAGKKMTCDACTACNGTATNRHGSIVIQAHGGTAVMSNIKKLAA